MGAVHDGAGNCGENAFVTFFALLFEGWRADSQNPWPLAYPETREDGKSEISPSDIVAGCSPADHCFVVVRTSTQPLGEGFACGKKKDKTCYSAHPDDIVVDTWWD